LLQRLGGSRLESLYIERVDIVIDTAIFAFQSTWGVPPREVVPLVRGRALAASWAWHGAAAKPVSNPVLPGIHCLTLLLAAMEGHFWAQNDMKCFGKFDVNSTIINAADSGSGWLSASPVSFFQIYLSDAYLRSFISTRPHSDVSSHPLRFRNAGVLNDGLVTELALTLSRSNPPSGTEERSYQTSLTDLLARHIVRCHTLPPGSIAECEFSADHHFDRLLEAINADPGQPYTVERFCQMTGMSCAQLTSRFKSRTGLTPYKYLIVQRLELAKQELEIGYTSLSDLAVRLGFVDQAHFSNAFRRHTGKTPGRARTPEAA
jgi:AraC-like DNA-binding protein